MWRSRRRRRWGCDDGVWEVVFVIWEEVGVYVCVCVREREREREDT